MEGPIGLAEEKIEEICEQLDKGAKIFYLLYDYTTGVVLWDATETPGFGLKAIELEG